MDKEDRSQIKLLGARSRTYGQANPIPDYEIEGPPSLKNTEGPQYSNAGSIDKSEISRQRKDLNALRESKAKMLRAQKAPDAWKQNHTRMMLYKLQKQFSFDEIRNVHHKEMIRYYEHDLKGPRKTLYVKQITDSSDLILNVVNKTRLELNESYQDRWPLLKLRKQIQHARIVINIYAYTIMKHKIFENFCIGVILANSFSLALEDPLAVTTTPLQDAMENVFLALYSTEMLLKIVGLGFLFNQGAYLRDPWNILDFIIVSSAYLTIFQNVAELISNGGKKVEVTAVSQKSGGLSLNSLRAFRVLRPLRAITSIKGLQILVLAVLQSLPLLQDTMYVLLAFFLVFAIAGCQLLMGLLKQTCVSIEDGTIWEDGYICGGMQTCPEGYFCGKQNQNPNYGVTNFDNILFGLLCVFQCITLEGWSDNMVMYQQGYSLYSFVYFFLIVIIGAFFLVNLLLAVINSSFSNRNAIEQAKMEAIRAKQKLVKKKSALDEDDFETPKDALGVTQYWIGKRVAKRLVVKAKAAHLRKLEREKQAGFFSDAPIFDQEPVPEMTEMSRPIIINKKQEEESEYDFSYELHNLLFDDKPDCQTKISRNSLCKTSTRPYFVDKKIEKKDQTREITRYAVSEMRTAHKLSKKRQRNQVIQTAELHNIAQKLQLEDEKVINVNTKQSQKIEDLDELLHQADTSAIDQSSIMHPFDLSRTHSEQMRYHDSSSQDERPLKKVKVQYLDSDDAGSSVVVTDSSFELQMKVIDEDKMQEKVQSAQKDADASLGLTNPSLVRKQSSAAAINSERPTVQPTISRKKKRRKQVNRKTTTNEAKYQNFKETIAGLDREIIMQRRSKRPQDYIEKTHKIEILEGMPYKSTSMNDVFEIRNKFSDLRKFQDANQFVKANIPDSELEIDQSNYILQEKLQPIYDAFQLKTCYQIIQDEPIEFDPDDNDAFVLALQPFDTCLSVGYGHLLTHRPIKFVTRKSDIIVSSTLQLTLTPADSGYQPKDHALMSRQEITTWCDKLCEYKAKDTQTASFVDEFAFKQSPESFMKRLSTIRPNESKMFSRNDSPARLSRQQSLSPHKRQNTFKSEAPSLVEDDQPKQQVHRERLIPPTLLTQPLEPELINLLLDEEKRQYAIQKGKFDAYIRICNKKAENGEHPKDRKFSLAEVPQLLSGGMHEEDDDEDQEVNIETGHMMYMCRNETFRGASLQDYENQARRVLHKQKVKIQRPKHDHIPNSVKQEFDLPFDIQQDSVNFDAIKQFDASRKRQVIEWSGQDVLQIGLTQDLSEQVADIINSVRVWPKGYENLIKKGRVSLKRLVKHTMFNSLMTFCVLLNTIVMGMQKYNMDIQLSNTLDSANSVFTWIFIFEMSTKVVAVGPKKYLQDKMNWLDGTVVSMSIFELLLTAVGGSGGNLSAFKTVRVFRTFRVLRIARLLRALKSMKVIIAVISRSASSFVYITLLMFVFIFIYTLLGMQVFGGHFNFPDGLPRGNFDSFIIAFLTVFQVLTTENWNSVLFDSMRSPEVGQFIPVIYLVSWIFIGNYILLNLFLAILLDGFVAEDDEEVGDLEEIQRQEQEARMLLIQKEKIRRLKKMGAETKQIKAQEEQKKKKVEEFIDDIENMDEQVIREIFMDEGLIKKKNPEREKKLLYQNIHCQNSLYVFSKQSKFRMLFYKIMKHKLFDNTIMFLIGISSIKLATDTYLKNYTADSIQKTVSDDIDIFLNAAFLFECITKIISMGFIMDEGSYTRETWNQLDLFIVFTSMLDMCLTNVNLPVIKILRLLRTLRPLRVISHNIAMKLIVNSLLASMGAIFNVMIVVLAVWLMFGIFAINVFAGKMFYCDICKYTCPTKFECNSQGGSWVVFVENFDDIFQAMLTLFNVAALEGWPDIMTACLDMVGVDQGPILEYSSVNGFFFVIFILIGSFFLMNFFVGVLFMKYSQAQKNEGKGYTEENLVWIDIQKMIIEQRCEFDLMNKPDHIQHPQRFKYWRIVTSKSFEIFILTIIVLNIVQMGVMYETASPMFIKLLGISDYFFTFIFVVEAYLKIRAYSWRYLDKTSNKFDCLIVVSSITDIIMSFAGADAAGSFSIGPQLARMMRVMRVTRIVRLASKNEGLQALMQTITLSVGSLTNVFILLLLVQFIFSILAVFFFGDLTQGEHIDDYHNFTAFLNSFQLIFILSTGENWNYFMYDCLNTPPNCVQGATCGTSLAPIYWLTFVMIVQNVMINLFVLVIIDQFEKYYMAEDNPITKFKKNLDVFMITWVEFTATRSRCIKLREKRLNEFFKKLPMPIGLPSDTSDEEMKKIMLKMGIKCDDGYVYFNELLYRCMRRQYGSFKLNRRMQIQELKTQYKIYMLKLQAQGLVMYSLDPQETFFQKTVGAGKAVNPFLQEMYFHISFTTWLNYARKMQKRVRFQQKQEIKRQKCYAEGVEFFPATLQEDAPKFKFVQIQVEEIFEVTSEGEPSSSEEEIAQAPMKRLSLPELKVKVKQKPYGGSISRGLSQIISQKKPTHNNDEFKLLGIGMNMSPARSASRKNNKSPVTPSIAFQPISANFNLQD